MAAGKAFGFFCCESPYEQVHSELQIVRGLVHAPSELELRLFRDSRALDADECVKRLAREAREAGMQYALAAAFPRHCNSETADELAVVMNQLYQTPLYHKGAPFRGEIVFKQGTEYVFKE